MGHSCLRLQCPTHDLDFIFSNEGEDASQQVLRFFAGKLMMGTFAIPTSEYLQQYSNEGRGVKEYVLNLPVHVKQRLWQQMDERLEQPHVPYDYMNRGCTVSVLSWIEAAITTDSIAYPTNWGEEYEKTQKEIGGKYIKSQWQLLFMSIICTGSASNPDIAKSKKVVTPVQLVELLSKTKAFERNLIDCKPNILLENSHTQKNTWFSPLLFALLLLAIAIANCYLHWKAVRIAFVSASFLLGCFIAYIIFFSSLPCTEWNWLIISFNPLPVFFWRWRKHWLLPFALVLIAWVIVMLLYPYVLFILPNILFVAIMAVVYFEEYLYLKQQY